MVISIGGYRGGIAGDQMTEEATDAVREHSDCDATHAQCACLVLPPRRGMTPRPQRRPVGTGKGIRCAPSTVPSCAARAQNTAAVTVTHGCSGGSIGGNYPSDRSDAEPGPDILSLIRFQLELSHSGGNMELVDSCMEGLHGHSTAELTEMLICVADLPDGDTIAASSC